MKTKNNFKIGSRIARSYYLLVLSSSFLCAMIMLGNQTSLQAQMIQQTEEPKTEALPMYTRPNWWFGVAAGANFNFFRGTTQQLNSDLTVPAAFHHGKGLG